MLTYVRTSILESTAHTITNTVNTVGVMGKGLASAMKQRYPEMFKAYRRLCNEKKIQIGKLWLWKTPERWILNFPTKQHWRNPSKLSYIEAGLQKFVAEYERRGIWEIAFPRLGCGNGGLDWNDVRPLMESYLGNLPIPVYVHDYEVDIGVPEHVQARRLPHLIFERSFPKFIDDLRSVIAASGGIFTTTQNHTSFRAAVDSGGDLWIEREQRTGSVRNEELYELWTLLLRGPVTRRKLAGRCREDAYYIFPILRALPYMRIIETQPRNSQIPAYAAELVEDAPIRQTIAASEAQGEFAWP